MVLKIEQLKTPQDSYHREGGIAVRSGKKPINNFELFNRDTNVSSIGRRAVARSFAPYPTNRYFGIFPISKGLSYSNDNERLGLREKSIMTAKTSDVLVNEQEQFTSSGYVAGKNEQIKINSNVRFNNYGGNSTGGHSRTKHAISANLSNAAQEIKNNFVNLANNPQVQIVAQKIKELRKMVA